MIIKRSLEGDDEAKKEDSLTWFFLKCKNNMYLVNMPRYQSLLINKTIAVHLINIITFFFFYE